jgi:hypothetical protein
MHFQTLPFESNPQGKLISTNANVAYKIYLVTIDNASSFTNAINQGVSDMS